jgi:hypothetical protein
MKYSLVSRKFEKIKKDLKSGNCQDFVEDILARLGIELKFEEPQSNKIMFKLRNFL